MLNKIIDLIRAYETEAKAYQDAMTINNRLDTFKGCRDAGAALGAVLALDQVVWYNGKGYASDLEGGVLVFTSLIAIPGMDGDVKQQRDEARQIVRNVAKRLIGVNEDARRAVAQWDKEDLRS